MKKGLRLAAVAFAFIAIQACDNQNTGAADTATDKAETQTPSDMDGGLDTADMDTTTTDSTMLIEE